MWSTSVVGNLCKMSTSLCTTALTVPQFVLPMKDVLSPLEPIPFNALVGKMIRLEYHGYINSVLSGERMTKAYGEGLTYKEFQQSPLASPSIFRPELSQIHNGVALRDMQWELDNHMQPHVAYIALTSNLKVGVTSKKVYLSYNKLTSLAVG